MKYDAYRHYIGEPNRMHLHAMFSTPYIPPKQQDAKGRAIRSLDGQEDPLAHSLSELCYFLENYTKTRIFSTVYPNLKCTFVTLALGQCV